MNPDINNLRVALESCKDIEVAVLFGSQALGNATLASDYDIAVIFKEVFHGTDSIGRIEQTRRHIAASMGIADTAIDIAEIRHAGLSIRRTVAEQGLVVVGENSLAWCQFLERTWRSLDAFTWEQQRAA
jgi:predicted nucleotidyltransferase